jgi:hypothetical protein
LKGNTVTASQTDPTAPNQDEPVTPTTPDLFIYQTPPPDPSARADLEALTDDEVEPDVDTGDDTEPDPAEVQGEAEDVAVDSEVHGDVGPDDDTEPEAVEVPTEADDEVEIDVDDDIDTHDETESAAAADGQPGHNGDGQSEVDPGVERPEHTAIQLGTLDPQDDAEASDVPADLAIEGRRFLCDGGAFEERWNVIQNGFVDDPHQAVESADLLVAEATEDLARILASHRESLQDRWRPEDDVDTEQLRVVFQSYRGFLHELLDT